ncbi:MAG: alkaline phosphatase family protein [Deltaproteobacteria bacterium]|nr:alkaline phosphatase family protein [Myxococcales bacterium]MDP3220064.1 alkaline phosphatase family protein [Deltaproteobacteria bacterium]
MPWQAAFARARPAVLLLLAAALGTTAGCRGCDDAARSAARLATEGNARDLRPDASRPATERRPGILLVALDGVPRDILYGLLRQGRLPGFARLLGGVGDGGGLAHAHLDETLLATLPSSTLAAWATTFTGVTPARHGISGNEFFIRESRRFIAPVPVSVESNVHTLETESDSLVDQILTVPTVYQRMRRTEPGVTIWVALSQVHGGADRFLLPDRSVLIDGITAHAGAAVGLEPGYAPYAQVDEAVLENLREDLDRHGAPDVLTLYLFGTDLYAHEAEVGPQRALDTYLREVLDPRLGALADHLQRLGALDDRFVVVVSDHGHTAVMPDDAHSLGTDRDGEDEPPTVLRRAGFRLRPFELEVPAETPFDAVLAYQGAMAFVYLADRTRCPGGVCAWSEPPRYREDVLAAAEAFHRANAGTGPVAAMRGTLDLILVRQPAPIADDDRPFEVYLGGGRTESIEDHLRTHPHPDYVTFASRMRDLAVGPRGERAGDVLLLAHNGDRPRPEDRYYFAHEYRSWHGSPSRADSELPFIVAQRHRSPAALAALVRDALGADRAPTQDRVADVLLALRRARRVD